MRYHGGKWRLAEWIVSVFPDHRIYTEAFGGAASVLMHKPRSYAEVYNDRDGELVNLFRVLRDRADELETLVRGTPYARDEFDLSYEPVVDDVEQARRTVVRTMFGYGSTAHNTRLRTGFRANSNRSGTSPAHDWQNYPDVIEAISERLRGVVIENRNGLDVIDAHDSPETLHYVDPPYVWSTRTGSPGQDKRSYRYEMDDAAHRELAGVLHSVEGRVVISGYASGLYDELYSDWRIVRKKALADQAARRIECLWISPNVEVQPELFG